MPEANPTPDMMPQGHIAIEEMARNGFDISMCPFLAKLAMKDPEAAKAIMDSTINNSIETATVEPARSAVEKLSSKPANGKPEKPAAIVETLALKPAANERLHEEVVSAVDLSAVKIAEQAKPKPEQNVKPISQVEQALLYMRQLEDKHASVDAPIVKPVHVAKTKIANTSDTRPEVGIRANLAPKRTETVGSHDSFKAEKPVELPVAGMELTATQEQEGQEIGTGMLQETSEYILPEENVSLLEFPLVVEPEDGQEPDYEALFQEMVAELTEPTIDSEEGTYVEMGWPEGLFELDSMEELVVEVRERAEAQALELPEVAPEAMELDLLPVLTDETTPLPAILEVVHANNEVLAEAEPVAEETESVAGEIRFSTPIPDHSDEKVWRFAVRPELDVAAAADVTNEPDYRDSESLFTIMREFMWAPGTNDFAVNNGSVGHRLGRLLVQLITGHTDITTAFAFS